MVSPERVTFFRFPGYQKGRDFTSSSAWQGMEIWHLRMDLQLNYFQRNTLSLFFHNITDYKITKIVRALWLAERSVFMRVCKHGCGVKLFGFSRVNHASTNLKKFSSSKLKKFTLFTHSFVGWNLENRYKGVSIFLRLSWHFKREKSVFCKASFCKTRTDYACKTSWTRFCDW